MLFPHLTTPALKRAAVRLALGACLSVVALPGIAAEAQLTVYTEFEERANFPDDSEQPVPLGPGYDIVSAMLAEAGYTADIRIVPWVRLIRSLESQANVLGFPMTRTPDREDRFHWIGLLRPVSFKLWTLPERAAEFPESLDAARDLRISAVRDDVVEQYLLDKGFTNLVYLSQTANTITMMRRNRVDLMPYIEAAMTDYLARKNEPPGTLVPVFDLEEISTGHYIVMSKQSDPELVRLLRNSYQAVVDSGVFASIMGADRAN